MLELPSPIGLASKFISAVELGLSAATRAGRIARLAQLGLSARRLWPIVERNADLVGKAVREAWGPTCVVLGNGPSMNQHVIAQVSSMPCLVTNSFYFSGATGALERAFYVIADHRFSELEDPLVQTWWKDFSAAVPSRHELFVPIRLAGFAETAPELAARRVRYFCDWQAFSAEAVERFDPTGAIPAVQNVLALCILLAMHMGFRRIVLAGADHNWLHDASKNQHFFADDPKKSLGRNKTQTYAWWLEKVAIMFEQYRTILAVAERRGIKIVNASEAGVLDVFPMVTLQSALDGSAFEHTA